MRALLLGIAAASLLASGVANAQPSESDAKRTCFFSTQFEGWRPVDKKTFYIRVNTSRYFRITTARDCPTLLWPQAHLVMNIRGPDTICSPVDWDLKVVGGDPGSSIPMPCIVQSMTELTPAEVQAIPPKFKP